jgi:transcriptional regulator with XRE-family HTH domain
MAKTYQNIEEMVKGLSEDKKFKKSVLHEIKSKMLSKYLFSLRCERNLTQGQFAKKIKCSQSRISKIENSFDEDITIKDLLEYGNALDLQLEVGYRRRNIKTVELIKHHYFKIKEYLNRLANLAGKDKSLIEGVKQFHVEAAYNMLEMVLESASDLDVSEETRKPKDLIHISPPAVDIPKKAKKEAVGKITLQKAT